MTFALLASHATPHPFKLVVSQQCPFWQAVCLACVSDVHNDVPLMSWTTHLILHICSLPASGWAVPTDNWGFVLQLS